MDVLITVLKALVVLVLLGGLIWSLRLGARQRKEMDEGISSNVKANPQILNPVLLSYVFIVALCFVLIWIFKLYTKFPF